MQIIRFDNWSAIERDTNMRLCNKLWSDLPQVTDDYVVHARGFSLGRDIWLDSYNMCGEHTHLWNDKIAKDEGYETYDGDWLQFAEGLNEPWLYWSITGSSVLLLQHPSTQELTEQQFQQLVDLLHGLQIPRDTMISVSSGEENTSIEASSIYDRVE